MMNLNRQAKLYSQGMKPLYKILPHQPQWERIKEKPVSGVRTRSLLLFCLNQSYSLRILSSFLSTKNPKEI